MTLHPAGRRLPLFRARAFSLLLLGGAALLTAETFAQVVRPPGGGGGGVPGGGGGVPGGGGAAAISRIVAEAAILVGDPSQAFAGTVPTTPATYAWTISGGRIVGSLTTATINYVADTAGTVSLNVAITVNGATNTLTSTVTAISAASAGTITAPASTAPATGATAATVAASVPSAQNGDRTFRWTTTGDAAIASGQGTPSITVRAGTPGLKEISCDVSFITATRQVLVTVRLRSFLLVNGDGAPTAVTINNGSGGGTYNANSRVDLFANPPPAGQVFDRWTGDVSVFGANALLAPFVPHLVITVPATPVALTATYKAAPAWTPVTVANFNPQTQPAGTGANQPTTPTTFTTTLAYHLPADAIGLVFLLHDSGSNAGSWFTTPEGALLVRDLVAAGYGVAALNSVNRNTGNWAAQAVLANNFDALNHAAALNKIAADVPASAGKPIFFLGLATGADAALGYANLLAAATPARNVRGAVLYCNEGSETLAVTSKVPQFFALAANDDVVGTAGIVAARSHAQLLAGRGLASATITNAVSPVHAGRFRALGVTAATFTATDATAVWTALKTAGLFDANNYLKALPTTAALTAALPAAYQARTADVAAQLAVAFAAQEFFSDANARVIAFLAARVAGTPAPTPGRLVNLSTRTKISYVDDSFTLGFNLGGGTDRATLLLRGIGPALAKFGVATAIAAPRLEINDSTGKLIASNERWDAPGGPATAAQLAAAAAGVGAFALAPGDFDTAVLLTNLAPGSYTATIKGVNGATGDVLAEVYDVTKNNTRLTNLSTLAKIAAEGDLLIPGIVVQGANPRTLVVRAVGPGLGDFGLPAEGLLTDPRITVLNAAGATVDTNNNWYMIAAGTVSSGSLALNAVFPAVGAFPLKVTNAADAALITALTNGNFTLQAGAAPLAANAPAGAPVPNATGSVLVEVYEVP